MFDDPSTEGSLLRKRWFQRAAIASALGSFVAFAVLTIGATTAVNALGRREAEEETERFGEEAGRVALAPYLVDALFTGSPNAMADIGVAAARFMASGPAVRVKVWARDGRVVYADDPRLVGRVFPLDEEEAALFDTQRVRYDVSTLDKTENALDIGGPSHRLLEVYFGTRTTSGTPVLVETYYPYELIESRASQLRTRFLPPMILALGLLAMVQVPLTLRLARRLVRREREREQLLEQVFQASTNERRRVIGEVHDGAVQELIGVSLRVAAASEVTTSPLKDNLRVIAADTRRIIRSIRSLLTSMYPVEVPSAGIAAGLDDLVNHLRSTGVSVTVDIDDDGMPPVDQLLTLRTAREALRNVGTHAAASRVVVWVRQEHDRWVLDITDDGRGFTPEHGAERRDDGHLGLQILHDIARDRGASLRVDSTPGIGTTVHLDTPVTT